MRAISGKHRRRYDQTKTTPSDRTWSMWSCRRAEASSDRGPDGVVTSLTSLSDQRPHPGHRRGGASPRYTVAISRNRHHERRR